MRVLSKNFPCSSCTCCHKCSPRFHSPSILNLEDAQQQSPCKLPIHNEEVNKSSNGVVEDGIGHKCLTDDNDEKSEENRQHDGEVEERSLSDVEVEDEKLDNIGLEIDKSDEERKVDEVEVLKSSFKKPRDSGSGEREKRNVKWSDFQGEELVEIHEYEHINARELWGEDNGSMGCFCTIQ